MWPDLQKRVLCMHSFKTHFSYPFDINGPTACMCNIAKSRTVCFFSGLFLQPLWYPCDQMAFKWPHIFLTSRQLTVITTWLGDEFGHGLSCLCGMYRWKWHQLVPFRCFSEDIGFACHFLTLTPYPLILLEY